MAFPLIGGLGAGVMGAQLLGGGLFGGGIFGGGMNSCCNGIFGGQQSNGNGTLLGGLAGGILGGLTGGLPGALIGGGVGSLVGGLLSRHKHHHHCHGQQNFPQCPGQFGGPQFGGYCPGNQFPGGGGYGGGWGYPGGAQVPFPAGGYGGYPGGGQVPYNTGGYGNAGYGANVGIGMGGVGGYGGGYGVGGGSYGNYGGFQQQQYGQGFQAGYAYGQGYQQGYQQAAGGYNQCGYPPQGMYPGGYPQGGGCMGPYGPQNQCYPPGSTGNPGGTLSQEKDGAPVNYRTSGGWQVQVNGDKVTMTSPDGKQTVQQWGDPHENVNGKHVKDWETKQRTICLPDGTKVTMSAPAANGVVEHTSIYDGDQNVQIANGNNEIQSRSFDPRDTRTREAYQYDGETARIDYNNKGGIDYYNTYTQDQNFGVSSNYKEIATTKGDQKWWQRIFNPLGFGQTQDRYNDPRLMFT